MDAIYAKIDNILADLELEDENIKQAAKIYCGKIVKGYRDIADHQLEMILMAYYDGRRQGK